jgi:hypothetical protein
LKTSLEISRHMLSVQISLSWQNKDSSLESRERRVTDHNEEGETG